MSNRMQSTGVLQFVKAVILNRWMVVVASFYIMTASGGVYSFGIYSQSLKLYLGYDQETLNTISFFKDIGTNVGVLGGILYDWTGPPLVFASGAGLNITGYLMIWLSVTGRVAKPEVWQMCFYFVLASSWTAFVNTACIVTCIKSFPLSRGIVIGLLKGSLGLGGAILTLMYRAIYGDKTEEFILLLAWFPTAVCLFLMFIIRVVNVKQTQSDMKYFFVFLVMILSLASYLMIVIITQSLSSISRSTNQIFCGVTLLLLLFPVCVVVRDTIKNRKLEAASLKPQILQKCPQTATQDTKHDLEASNSLHPAVLSAAIVDHHNNVADAGVEKAARLHGSSTCQKPMELPLQKHKTCSPDFSDQQISPAGKIQPADSRIIRFLNFVKQAQRPIDHLTPALACFNLNLWIISIAATCGIGSQLMVIDNLGQIGAALGYSPKSIVTCVSLVSIWNCLGRVGSGFISEGFLQRKAVPRPFFLVVVLIISCIGHLILAFNLPTALYLGSVIIGLCYGAQFTLIFTIVSEICGLRFYATIFNVLQLSSPLGLYLLSVRTAGVLYDNEAKKERPMLHLSSNLVKYLIGTAASPLASPPHSATRMSGSTTVLLCHGSHCYKTSFLIMTGASVIGAIFACILTIRTRCLYKHLYNLHNPKEAEEMDQANPHKLYSEDLIRVNCTQEEKMESQA